MTRKRLLGLGTACLLVAGLAAIVAHTVYYADTYASPSGSDANSCSVGSPCLTMQRAADAVGSRGTVHLGDGTYNGTIDISHFKFVTVLGNCSNLAAVVINVPSGAAGFRTQDHATGVIGCVTLNGGSGSIGVISRQFAIVDYYNVRFGAFPAGTHVAAVEESKSNCGGTIEIFGGAVVHGTAGGLSTLLVACTINITGSPAIDYFYIGTSRSLIQANTAVYSGNSVGMQYIMQDASLLMNVTTVPGTTGSLLYNGGQAY